MATLIDFIDNASLREREELERALLKGESLRWATKPLAQLWCAESIIMFLSALPVLGFIAFWTYGALGFPTSAADFDKMDAMQIPFALFSIPFWCAAFWLASAPWRRVRKLRRTVYAITNRRALVVEPGFRTWTVRPFTLDRDMVMERQSRSQGSGDLVFDIEYHRGSKGGTRTVRQGFLCLADLQQAEHKLDEAIAALPADAEARRPRKAVRRDNSCDDDADDDFGGDSDGDGD